MCWCMENGNVHVYIYFNEAIYAMSVRLLNAFYRAPDSDRWLSLSFVHSPYDCLGNRTDAMKGE